MLSPRYCVIPEHWSNQIVFTQSCNMWRVGRCKACIGIAYLRLFLPYWCIFNASISAMFNPFVLGFKFSRYVCYFPSATGDSWLCVSLHWHGPEGLGIFYLGSWQLFLFLFLITFCFCCLSNGFLVNQHKKLLKHPVLPICQKPISMSYSDVIPPSCTYEK